MEKVNIGQDIQLALAEGYKDLLMYGTMVFTTDSEGYINRVDPREVLKDFPETEE